MDVNDLKGLYAEVNKRMHTAMEHVRHELARVRTGRASVTSLDVVHVEAYGANSPLTHSDSVAHRRTAQGALAPRSQTERRRAEQRAPGPPRRERAAEETAQGSQDLRRRRAEGARRGAEADRQPHQTDRRAAEEEGCRV